MAKKNKPPKVKRHRLDEPLPQPGEMQVAPLAMLNWVSAARGQVLKGEEKYHTPLQTFNKRNAYRDYLQESVDGTFYATQLYIEALQFAELTQQGVKLITSLREHVDGDDAVMTDDLMGQVATYLARGNECIERSGLLNLPDDLSVASASGGSTDS